MYQVYVGTMLFYSPTAGDAYQLSSAVLKMGVNKAGSFEFTMPVDNVAYNTILTLQSRITVLWNGTPLWEGFPVSIRRDWYNSKTVVCNGQLAVLNDGILPGYQIGNTDADSSYSTPYAQLIDNVFQVFNSQMESRNAVVLGDCDFSYVKDVSGNDMTSTTNFSAVLDYKFPTVWEWLTNMTDFTARSPLQPPYNGYIVPQYDGPREADDSMALTIDIKEDSGDTSDQTIEFGKNLINFEEYANDEDIITIVYPTGQYEDDDGNTQLISMDSTDNLGYGSGNFVEAGSTILSAYGRRIKYIHYEDVSDCSLLEDYATKDLYKLVAQAYSVSLSAVDLSLLDVDLGAIKAGNYYQVISEPHELAATFQCSETTLDLLSPESSVYTFGTTPKTFTTIFYEQWKDN